MNLEADMSKGNMLISVKDSGIGIALENLARIFDPYFTTKTRGSGLGLAIVRRIVEAHGGTITVVSKVGQGSRFQIALPMNRKES